MEQVRLDIHVPDGLWRLKIFDAQRVVLLFQPTIGLKQRVEGILTESGVHFDIWYLGNREIPRKSIRAAICVLQAMDNR